MSSPDEIFFDAALDNIERFIAGYYEKQVKVYISDDVIESIRTVKSFLKSFLHFDEQKLSQARVDMRQLLQMNADGAVDFGDNPEKIRGMLLEIEEFIRPQRDGVSDTLYKD